MAYSYVQYVGNSSTVTFSVPFPYISKEHIEVRVDNVLKSLDTDYTWSSSSAITFVTAPGTGLTVDIRRRSNPSARLVDFQDGSTLTQDILDADSNQNFFLSQESFDAVDQRLPLDTDGQWNANSRRIKNVDDPTSPQDVVTKNWAENSATSFIVAAQSQANAASSSATAAANSAASAAGSATSATSSANSASTSANTATTKATEASTSATNAATSATNAANSATSAATSATAAQGYLATVASNASAAATSATAAAASATTATARASDAATSATNAASSASAAATSANNAASSQVTASNAATAAANSAASASTSATTATTAKNDAVAIYSGISAVNAAVTSAQTSATNSASSATQAATSATNAANSATSAANSATSAASSSVSAATSATNAAALYGSASALNTAVNSAQNSATNAGTSAAQASGYVSTVATSATNAANSATQAANSAASAAAIVTGVASNRPSIRPSLLLDFEHTKQLDPRITFSRPTTARYYDGKTVVKAEENLLQYSQEFDNAWWKKNNQTVTANSTTAPDGTLTADTVSETATSGFHVLAKEPYSYNSGVYTFSIYVKANGRTKVSIGPGSTSIWAADASYDLTAVTATATYGTAAIIDAGSGWYRLILTGISAGGSSTLNAIVLRNDAGAVSYTGDGVSGVYIWGAQLEQRSTVTAYTPTTTAPITNYIPALQTAVSNEARFDHDPVTGESRGMLIEEQRTNVTTYSQDFDNAAWTKTNGLVNKDVVIAPDGTLTGNKFTPSLGTVDSGIVRNLTGSPSSISFSVYLKQAGIRYVQLGWSNVGAYNAVFDLETGNITQNTVSANAPATIQSCGNGWWRCTINSGSVLQMDIKPLLSSTNVGGAATITYDGYAGFYIWGAQAEVGATFPTSYIPTVASQVTRSADSASMTGSNFSSWYRADEGTVYAEALSPAATGFYFASTISDGTSGNEIRLGSQSGGGNYQLVVSVAGSGQASLSGQTVSAGTLYKVAGCYKANDFASSVNNSAVATDTAGSIPLVNQLSIGSRGDNTYRINGTIKRIAYYPKRLSNTELQGLTS